MRAEPERRGGGERARHRTGCARGSGAGRPWPAAPDLSALLPSAAGRVRSVADVVFYPAPNTPAALSDTSAARCGGFFAVEDMSALPIRSCTTGRCRNPSWTRAAAQAGILR
ncbi:hypothetical protein [Nocardia niwae]|uniref:hypothetical protein n=1 Tax=Nocardia niwae TaxID=626084 RepID=UPI0033D70ADE